MVSSHARSSNAPARAIRQGAARSGKVCMAMNELRLKVWSRGLYALLLACGAAPQHSGPAPIAADPCSGAQAVPFSDVKRAGTAFGVLARPHSAKLVFACPTGTPCTLPPDTTIEFSAQFRTDVACEFTACRIPYAFAGMPFEPSAEAPCPPVLWATAALALRTDAGTIDLSGELAATRVNVLARREGDGYLRFIVESPSSMQRWLASEQPRAVLLDIQLEVTGERVRGQVSALAAPLPAEPAAELRFTSLWTATWQEQP